MGTTAITIGTFDGVHLGHADLLARARSLVGPTGRVLALAFDPHPAAILRPHAAPPRLSSFTRRQRLLLAAGADQVLRLNPADGTLELDPLAFVQRVLRDHQPSHWIEGPDFRFGKRRAGSVLTLAELAPRLGFEAVIVTQREITLSDDLLARASSSLTRWLLAHARVRDAALVLGRPHAIAGPVLQGDQRGRTIGFPTANLHSDEMPPADGVYAALATLPSGDILPAAVNVGTRPTVGGIDRRVEAHIMLPDRPLPAPAVPQDYGWTLDLQFIGFIRDQVRFPSFDALRLQLSRDAARAHDLARHALTHPAFPSPAPSHASPIPTHA